VGNKRHRLSGDMAFAFKKWTESSEKNKDFEAWIIKGGNWDYKVHCPIYDWNGRKI
jgi:hypothetical protein